MDNDLSNSIAKMYEGRVWDYYLKLWDLRIKIIAFFIPVIFAYIFRDFIYRLDMMELITLVFLAFQIGLIVILPEILAGRIAKLEVKKMQREGVFDPSEIRADVESPINHWVDERFSYLRRALPSLAIVQDHKHGTETNVDKNDYMKLIEICIKIEDQEILTEMQRRRAIFIARRALCMTVVGEADNNDSFRSLSTQAIVDRIIDSASRFK